jgi:hypothetical protein
MVNHQQQWHEPGVPEVLQQRCHRVEGSSFAFRDAAQPETGHQRKAGGGSEGGILTWRGESAQF